MFHYWQIWGWISIITPSSKYNNTRIRQTSILEISFLSFFLNKSSKLTNYNFHTLKSFSWNFSRNGRVWSARKGFWKRELSIGNSIYIAGPPTGIGYTFTIQQFIGWFHWFLVVEIVRSDIHASPLSLSSSTNPYFDPANIAGSKHSYIFRGENYARLDLLVGDRQA